MYSNVEYLRRAFRQVDTAGITGDELEKKGGLIDQAGGLVDAVLAVRYAVPFGTTPDNTPPIIRDVTTYITLGWLINRMPATPEWLAAQIAFWQGVLDKLATGDMVIVGVDGAIVPESGDGRSPAFSSTEAYDPVFGGVPDLSERFDPVRRHDEKLERS